MNFLKYLFFGFAKIRQNFDNIWQNAIDKFKYLGLYITEDLSNTYNIKNCVLQAMKALGAMMPNIFRNPHLLLYVKNYCTWLSL